MEWKSLLVIWHGKRCRIDRISIFTKKLPFAERTLEQISPDFGFYSRFFKFVVSFHKAEYSMRISFRKNVLHCRIHEEICQI